MHKSFPTAVFAGALLSLTALNTPPLQAAPDAQLTVDVNKPGAPISPLFIRHLF